MNVEKVAELQLVDDGLVYPLGISYLVFPLGKSIDCDGFYVKSCKVQCLRNGRDNCAVHNVWEVD